MKIPVPYSDTVFGPSLYGAGLNTSFLNTPDWFFFLSFFWPFFLFLSSSSFAITILHPLWTIEAVASGPQTMITDKGACPSRSTHLTKCITHLINYSLSLCLLAHVSQRSRRFKSIRCTTIFRRRRYPHQLSGTFLSLTRGSAPSAPCCLILILDTCTPPRNRFRFLPQWWSDSW